MTGMLFLSFNKSIAAAVCCLVLSLVSCRTTQSVPATADAGSETTHALEEEAITTELLANHSGPSLRDGVFSREQVSNGRKIFFDVCIECHQPEAFVGPGFMDAWTGQTVDVLFQEIRSTMPENAPGRLSRREYVELLAFVFEKNGLPPGDTDMPNRPEQLKDIIIVSAPR